MHDAIHTPLGSYSPRAGTPTPATYSARHVQHPLAGTQPIHDTPPEAGTPPRQVLLPGTPPDAHTPPGHCSGR